MTDQIKKTVEIKAPVERVWQALTDHRAFGEWFQAKLENRFEPGKTTEGQITYPGFEHVRFEVRVERMEAPETFAYSWHPYAVDPDRDYAKEPMTLVEFHLEETAAGTQLTVTESGFDKLPANRRDEALRMNTGGWEEQVKNIKEYVEP